MLYGYGMSDSPVWHQWPHVIIPYADLNAAQEWLHANDCHLWQNRYPDRHSYNYFYGSRGNDVIYVMRINDPQIAMRFKLSWGGV
jgi:hypothetical protein